MRRRTTPACVAVFLVAWCSLALAQTPDPVGNESQVNTFTGSEQKHPAAVATAGGGVAVVWDSWDSGGTDTDGESVQGQL